MKKSTTEKSQNPEESKQTLVISSIKLQNIGPFDELGLTINFGKKLNTKKANNKANIHIFTGENGSGKTTILYGLIILWLHSIVNHSIINKLIGRNETYETGSKIEISASINNSEILSKFSEEKDGKILQNNFDKNKKRYNDFFAEKGLIEESIGLNFWWTILLNSMIDKFPAIFVDGAEIHNLNMEKVGNAYKTALLRINLEKENRKLTTTLTKLIKDTQEELSQLLKKKFEFDYQVNNDIFSILIDGKKINYLGESNGKKTLIALFLYIFITYAEKITSKNASFGYSKPFTLFLDEIDIHLHPALQRKILPALQTLFPNAEIFCTTHSPFVVNSVSDAWVYKLNQKHGIIEPISSNNYYGKPIEEALDEEFDISYNDLFDTNTQEKLDNFKIQVKDFYKKPTRTTLEKIKKEFEPMMKISREVAEIINFNFEKMYEKIL